MGFWDGIPRIAVAAPGSLECSRLMGIGAAWDTRAEPNRAEPNRAEP